MPLATSSCKAQISAMATTKSLLPIRIKHLRVALGLSQEALAEKAGRSIETVSNIERGTNSPTLETLEELAFALGVKIVDLLDHHNAGKHEGDVMRIISVARSLGPKELEVAATQIEALASLKL